MSPSWFRIAARSLVCGLSILFFQLFFVILLFSDGFANKQASVVAERNRSDAVLTNDTNEWASQFVTQNLHDSQDAEFKLNVLSEGASAVGVPITKIKIHLDHANASTVVVFGTTTQYIQYKKFLRILLRGHSRLVLVKLVAQRLPAPTSAVSFESTVAVLPRL